MPGQHPSELAQQFDLTRLQGVVAELDAERGRNALLIRQLQGAAGPKPLPPTVNVLPSAPVDGQVAYFQTTAMANDGILWELRYRAASVSPYKWEFIGGSDLKSLVVPLEGRGLPYGDLTTIGPQITIPLVGEYDLDFGFGNGYNSTSAGSAIRMDLDGCGLTAQVVTAHVLGAVDVSNMGIQPGRIRRVSTLTATGLLTAKYRADGGAGWFANRYLFAHPVRV